MSYVSKVFTIILLIAVSFSEIKAEEFVLVDDIITYDMSSSGAFIYKQIQPEMPDNWISPNNYFIGRIYQRYEVISVATDAPFAMQFGIWQYRYDSVGTRLPKDGEIVSPQLFLSGAGSTAEDNSIPNTNAWYKINGGVDFTKMKQSDIRYMGLVIWAPDPLEPIAQYGHVDTSFSGIHWTEREKWFPVTIKVTIVAVSNGSTFSGWESYVGVKPPTPGYEINYDSITTKTAVASSDEYSYSSDMNPAYSGTDALLDLTPGQDVYFRTPAQGYNPESDIQHLVVPDLPEAPAFTIDYDAVQTEETVGTSIEYADNSGMTDAVTGTNTVLDLTPGEDVYFRQKAGTSNFQSPVFHLSVPEKPAAPVVSIDYDAVTTNEVLPASVEYSTNSDMSSSSPCAGTKLSLDPGTDLYFRLASTASGFASDITPLVVPNRPATPAITINFDTELSSVVGSELEYDENSNMSSASSGSNVGIALTPGNNSFIRVKASASSFASLIQELVVPARPATPAYSANFLAEETNEVISADDIYSLQANMSGSHPGTGTRLDLTPGQNLYFQTPGTSVSFKSEVQTLSIPARPATPVFTIDFVNESTNEAVSDAVISSTKGDMSNPVVGKNSTMTLTPGTNLFFQISATESSFSSGISELEVPGRNILGYSGAGTVSAEKIICYAVLRDAGIEFKLDHVNVVNGNAANLRTGNAFDVYPSGVGNVEVSIPANTISENSFASNTIVVNFSEVLSLSSTVSSDNLETYPMPALNGEITVKLNSGSIRLIELYSLNGVKMFAEEFEGVTESILNLYELPAGTYILRVHTDSGISSRKIIR